MLIKTILNNIEKFKSFVYEKVYCEIIDGKKVVVVELISRKNSKGKCHGCGKPCGTYDTQPARYYEYVPLWGIPVYFRVLSKLSPNLQFAQKAARAYHL